MSQDNRPHEPEQPEQDNGLVDIFDSEDTRRFRAEELRKLNADADAVPEEDVTLDGAELAEVTGGDSLEDMKKYIVGPTRTGKSTFTPGMRKE